MPCLIAEASHQSQKLARSSPISSGSSAQRTECKSCHGSIKATDLYYTCSVCDRRGIYCWPCALAAFRFDDHSLLVSSMNLPKSAFQMMQYAADAGVHIWGARAWKFMTPCSRLEAKYVYCLWNFQPTEFGELKINEGDVIRILENKYKGWHKGYLGGNIGVYPENYVQTCKIHPDIASKVAGALCGGSILPESASVELYSAISTFMICISSLT